MAKAPGWSPPNRMGMLITRYRAGRGLTQRQLAVAAGVSLGAVRDLEQGRTACPRWGTVESVAAALQVGQRERAELLHAWRSDSRIAVGAAAGEPDKTGAIVDRVHIEVLGPVSARVNGSVVALGSPRQRALLGLLAVNHGISVHRDVIAEALWRSAGPPSSALAQLQGYVWRLRKLLGSGQGDAAQLITTVGAGYQLRADGDQLDAVAFRQLAAAASLAAARRRSPEACQLYEQALDLWRGEVLADVELLRDHPAVAELAHRHSDAVLGYAETAIRAGLPHRALPRLRALCGRDPFHEAAHARLMIALAVTGQQAAALDAFSKLRHRLRDELGIGPGPELVRVHVQILRQQFRSGQPPTSRHQSSWPQHSEMK
jgi:DNA-binding SARP family transcriptional activator/transcriptional regulator with XRE-family HTH domain